MTTKDVLEISTTILLSLGGGSGIVFGLSNYIGKRWADRALEEQKQKYAQLNLQFQSQLDIASRRLQVEFDALSLIHKLRTQEEFSRLAELWKRMANVRDYFEAIAGLGLSLGYSDEEMQKQQNEKMRMQFNDWLAKAQQYLSEEMLFIPKHIAEAAAMTLKEAIRETFTRAGFLPYLGIDVPMTVKYREYAAEYLANYKSGCAHLEELMREHIAGGGSSD
jgi:hypothetical protein